jgi:hypothetical protein
MVANHRHAQQDLGMIGTRFLLVIVPCAEDATPNSWGNEAQNSIPRAALGEALTGSKLGSFENYRGGRPHLPGIQDKILRVCVIETDHFESRSIDEPRTTFKHKSSRERFRGAKLGR